MYEWYSLPMVYARRCFAVGGYFYTATKCCMGGILFVIRKKYEIKGSFSIPPKYFGQV